MSPLGPLNALPIACTLTPGAGKAQLEKWRMFDAEHALRSEHAEDRFVIHYAKTDESATRLQELVAVERSCCSFVQWQIVDDTDGLRLVVTGASDQLAALNVGQSLDVLPMSEEFK